MVYISVKQNINLVHEDYYPKGIDHQQMIDKVDNTNTLIGEIQITQKVGAVEIIFPDDFEFSNIMGEVLFYRPSDFNEDLAFKIQLSNDGKQSYSTEGMKKGKWVVQLEWIYGETEYYFEKAIHVE